jgi:hypothetical protein
MANGQWLMDAPLAIRYQLSATSHELFAISHQLSASAISHQEAI